MQVPVAQPEAAQVGHHADGALPGTQPDGSILLPNQWSLRPAGRQVELADFPINVAVHPAGRYAVVLHSGYSAHQLIVVDVPGAAVVYRTRVPQSFYGLEFSRDGRMLYCSGAGEEMIHSFEFDSGRLTNHARIKLRDQKLRGVPAGLALDEKARTLYVANVWGDRVSQVDLGQNPVVTEIPLGAAAQDLQTMPAGADKDFDTAAATKRAEQGLFDVGTEDTFPYGCLLDERHGRLYVSLWAQAAVGVLDLKSRKVTARWPTQEHPCEMALTRSGKYLYVANSCRNTVSVLDTESGKAIETIWAALYPDSPPGSTPNSIALSPDEQTLFVANADNNTVAVFDISTPGKSRSLGFIPVGWYPTSVRVTPDGKRLLVANGKGIAPKANPQGPQPGRTASSDPTVEYIARLFRGTLSIIDLPSKKQLEPRMAEYSAQAYLGTPTRSTSSVSASRPDGNPIPLKPGDPSPIQYCVYIVKENRTYDQMLGDMPQGNGDASLCLFPEHVTPNHHKLAKEFVLLDNFYVDSEVSADGHEWTMGAYATDFVEKMWPLQYGHNRPSKFPYPAEGNFQVAFPAGGYLWDRAREAGVSYRSYGEFVNLHAAKKEPTTTLVKSLEGHIDENYRGFDVDYPDVKRAARFISEWQRFERDGRMPKLQIVRLGNDHTHGATPGKKTPTACVADNDLALGQIVEAISKSKFWPQTAIFVVEDDAQNGPDHVDAHRSIAFVISPYTRRAAVDSTMYSTSGMLRTIELILGLKPMSQFDSAAAPMFNAFANKPDARPYEPLPANVDLEAKNRLLAWGGRIKMDFSHADAVDDLLLNEVVWRSVRGPDHPMPAPIRAAFVRPHPKKADED